MHIHTDLHTQIQIVSSTCGMLSTAMLFVAAEHSSTCGMDEERARVAQLRRRRFNLIGISALFLSFAGSMASALI